MSLVLLGLMALAPWVVPKREFGGVGYLLTPFGAVNPQNLELPATLGLGWVGAAFWVWVGLMLAASLAFLLLDPRSRSRTLYALGALGVGLFALEAVLFYQAVNAANEAALAGGAPRAPLRRFTLSLGAYLGFFYAVALLLLARLQLPGGKAFLVRYRGAVVPVVSLVLSVLVGALLILVLGRVPGVEGLSLSLREWIALKLDLITFSFQLLFSPIYTLSGWFNSLQQTTPLIFAGLAVAFAFRAGLFNIGGPGQITLGAIFVMIVGVFMPGPGWIVLPLSILAAALGGALWGGLAGWLKARFGANEVVNTIMLNYIAASVLLFFLASNQQRFFNYTFYLPFKAQGFEAKSLELRPEAQLPLMINLLAPGGEFSWALPMALVAGLVVFFFLRRADLGRRLLLTGGAAILGYAVGGLIPGPAVAGNVMRDLAASKLNGSFLLAVGVLILVHYYLLRTVGGYEMRAAGLAPKAAEYAGINLGRKIVLAMLISGALAGLAATHYVQGGVMDEYRLKQSIPVGVGFDGIAVALMGQNTSLGVALAGFLFGVLRTGGLDLSQQLGISRELVTVIISLVVLAIALGGLLPRYFTDPLKAAQVETEAKDEEEALTKTQRAS
ncbi:inner-membrane translocator [Allomeiothermus silvanus DSM 9946]|uniref:Inner-membrane translocator n=2 Tax=Allomeiothermus silvanus TaxID=52022 RepID=D7BAN3_ALLS1|nr:inner-membrane translocator [Allomeiothermus silvanus DSM 9946]